MPRKGPARWIGSGPFLAVLLLGAPWPSGAAAQPSPTPFPGEGARPPLILAVALDEAGIGEVDLQRGQDLVLALFDALPQGSQMTLATFSGDKRTVLPPTADRALLAASFAGFKAGTSGVALPDGLFDMVGYLGSLQADAKALLLVSAGRVREGDLQFEDPLNAAVSRHIPIFGLGLGQGDGRLLRRITKITGGEFVRLEVADASMLAQLISPGSSPDRAVSLPVEGSPSPKAESRTSPGLLGAAAVFFSLGGLLMLGIVFLLIRRLAAPDPSKAPPALPAPPRGEALPPPPPVREVAPISRPEDETMLEKTLVVNANPILRALSGPGAGKNFPLSVTGRTSIGRSRRNDIVVPEDGASAQHCRIDREGDSFVLHDLGATNGTWVNGARTDRALLQHGDRLKVGETVFTVSLFGDRD